MGYRCPICREDFGRDKKRFLEHAEREHMGIGKMMVDTVRNAAEGDGTLDRKKAWRRSDIMGKRFNEVSMDIAAGKYKSAQGMALALMLAEAVDKAWEKKGSEAEKRTEEVDGRKE